MGFMKQLAHTFGFDSSQGHREDEIRGWTVVDDSGREVGRIDDLLHDDTTHEMRYAIVNLRGRQVLFPISALKYDESRHRAIAKGFSNERLQSLREYRPGEWNAQSERQVYQDFHPDWKESDTLDYSTPAYRGEVPKRIQLMEEQLRLGKRDRQMGEVTLEKRPVTETVEQDVTLKRDQIEIDRRTVDRPVEGEVTFADGSDTIRVPLYAEEAVIEKQPFVREEVAINKVADTHTETVREELKHEELVTEGLDQQRQPMRESQRELTFSGTEPTEEELRRREFVNREPVIEQRQIHEDVDIRPLDDRL